jgi:hypothetical protein
MSRQATAGAIGGCMSAINAVQGVPMAANKELLLHTLKGDFGFQGFVVQVGVLIYRGVSEAQPNRPQRLRPIDRT